MKALDDLIAAAGLTQAEIAAGMGLDPSTVSNKVAGRRRWSVADLQALRGLLSERLGRLVSLDEMAADTTTTTEEVAS